MFFGALHPPAPRGSVFVSSEPTTSTTQLVGAPADVPKVLRFQNNARIEAFAAHLRNLVTFLYSDEYPKGPDDVSAQHFLPGPDPHARWLKARPALSKTLRRAKARADKEVAHLTSKRIAGEPKVKEWDMPYLATELRDVLRVFLLAADPLRLGERVARTIPAGTL